jgi:hypothetical protein
VLNVAVAADNSLAESLLEAIWESAAAKDWVVEVRFSRWWSDSGSESS